MLSPNLSLNLFISNPEPGFDHVELGVNTSKLKIVLVIVWAIQIIFLIHKFKQKIRKCSMLNNSYFILEKNIHGLIF